VDGAEAAVGTTVVQEGLMRRRNAGPSLDLGLLNALRYGISLLCIEY
jgi:hypothetical protein